MFPNSTASVVFPLAALNFSSLSPEATMRAPSGPGGYGSGPVWHGHRPASGLVHGFLYNLCSALSSCFYVFCCCWLIEDCFTGRRYGPPRPPFGIPDQQPAPPRPPIGPSPIGFTGSHLSHFGPSGLIPQTGPIGYPGEPPRF